MTSRALRMLYRDIPAVSPCKSGCHACCGPVPWTVEEFARVRDRLPAGSQSVSVMGVASVQNAISGMCAFLGLDGCSVYADRPFMCRIFGATKGDDKLQCPHGVGAARPLSAAKASALTAIYAEMKPGDGARDV